MSTSWAELVVALPALHLGCCVALAPFSLLDLWLCWLFWGCSLHLVQVIFELLMLGLYASRTGRAVVVDAGSSNKYVWYCFFMFLLLDTAIVWSQSPFDSGCNGGQIWFALVEIGCSSLCVSAKESFAIFIRWGTLLALYSDANESQDRSSERDDVAPAFKLGKELKLLSYLPMHALIEQFGSVWAHVNSFGRAKPCVFG